MRIVFLVERPTQFEAPFFRWVEARGEHDFAVLFTAPDAGAAPFDPELGRRVDWGFDLLVGYEHQTLPAAHRARWLDSRLEPGCDLLIVNGYTRRPYLQGALAARRARVRVALRIDSVDFASRGPRSWPKDVAFRLVVRQLFDSFLAAGTLTRAYLSRRGVPASRIGFLPYAIDDEDFRRRADLARPRRDARRGDLGIPATVPVVLALAKLNEREAPWDLVGALPALRASTAWLLVAGDGPRRAEIEAAARSALPGRVVFTGYWPYSRLPDLYTVADLFVHAPREERWGVSVAEALACGLPVVAGSRVGSSADLLAAGENGFVYRTGDASDLAAKAGAAMSLARASVRAASDRLLAQWSYEAAWREILRLAARPS